MVPQWYRILTCNRCLNALGAQVYEAVFVLSVVVLPVTSVALIGRSLFVAWTHHRALVFYRREQEEVEEALALRDWPWFDAVLFLFADKITGSPLPRRFRGAASLWRYAWYVVMGERYRNQTMSIPGFPHKVRRILREMALALDDVDDSLVVEQLGQLFCLGLIPDEVSARASRPRKRDADQKLVRQLRRYAALLHAGAGARASSEIAELMPHIAQCYTRQSGKVAAVLLQWARLRIKEALQTRDLIESIAWAPAHDRAAYFLVQAAEAYASDDLDSLGHIILQSNGRRRILRPWVDYRLRGARLQDALM